MISLSQVQQRTTVIFIRLVPCRI